MVIKLSMRRKRLPPLLIKIYSYFPFYNNEKYISDIKRFFLYFTALFLIVSVGSYLFLKYGIDLLPKNVSEPIGSAISNSYSVYNNSLSSRFGTMLKESGFLFALFIAVNNFISCLMLIILGYLKLYPKKYFRTFFDSHGNDYINKWLVYVILTYQGVIIGVVAGLCAAMLSPFIIVVGVLPHYVFEIFAISFAASSGFYLRQVESGKYKEFLKIVLFLIIILSVSACIEGYVSSGLVNYFFKCT